MWRILHIWMFLVGFAGSSFGQVPISGIVNSYHAVDAIDRCRNAVVLDGVVGLAVGDRLMLHQAKGAVVTTTQSASFGAVQSLQGAGLWEWHQITGINNDTVFLEHVIHWQFNPAGALQAVRVAYYDNASVVDTVFARPWDGRTGGIVAIDVDGSLNLFAPIYAAGMGFRGGDTLNDPNCALPFANLAYSGNRASGLGARKGEGIASSAAAHELGRGQWGNGGGGGNDHNSGGGGGGNAGAGGLGGERYASVFSCPGPYPGIGGADLNYGSGRLFFGGGGGAGDQNNNVGTAGGHGGGIVVLNVPNFQANGRQVFIQGTSAGTSGGDGSGGGGAAGSFLLDATFINGVLRVVATGGDGGDTDNSNDPTFCMGPGGGGGGGYVGLSIVNPTANLSAQVQGGQAGLTVNGNANAQCFGSSNGAQPGGNGRIEWATDSIAFPRAWTPLTAVAGNDTTICPGGSARLLAIGGGSYLWSPAASLNNPALPAPVASPQQTTTYTVVVSDSIGCVDSAFQMVTVLAATQITVSADTAICSGASVTLTAAGATTYNWLPANLVDNPTAAMVRTAPASTSTYTVTGQIGSCPPDTQYVTVTILPPPTVSAGPDTTIPEFSSVQMIASAAPPGSYSWQWEPPDGLDDPSAQNPVASPQQSTTYTVYATDTNGCEGSTVVIVGILPPSIIDSIFIPNAFSPNGDGRNDEWFVPFGEERGVEHIEIFNRWGQLLLSGDATLRWDGLVGGTPQPMDTYMYRILQRDNIGYLRQWEGWIILLR